MAVLPIVDVPCADVQLAPVDDTGEFKEHGEPAPHPHTVQVRHIHHLLMVTAVLLEHLETNIQSRITGQLEANTQLYNLHILQVNMQLRSFNI